MRGLFAAGVTGTGWGWRDDLERYRGTDGLTTDVLDRFQAQGNGVPVTFCSTAEEAWAGSLRSATLPAPVPEAAGGSGAVPSSRGVAGRRGEAATSTITAWLVGGAERAAPALR